MDKDLIFLLEKIKRNRNIDFRQYQPQTLKNRIQSRFSATNCKTYWDYILLLNKDPGEYDRLISSLTIKVSEFFRDIEMFGLLENAIIPEIISQKQDKGCKKIRCWSCGAALGQEAYSMAILFCEALGTGIYDYDLNISATDIDQEVLENAPWGSYDKNALKNIKPHLLFKYFTMVEDRYVISDKPRLLVNFKYHDITANSQTTGMDLILCRNLLIYFQKDLQQRVLNSLYMALNPGGFLVLGKAESLFGTQVEGCLEAMDVRERVYRRN